MVNLEFDCWGVKYWKICICTRESVEKVQNAVEKNAF